MDPDTDPAKRYTDREVQLILKSAVERQSRSDHSPDGLRGMSLAQLEQVAREAGIDPTLIRQAAADLDAGGDAATESNAFLGGPTAIMLERVVDRSFAASDFDRLLDAVRSTSGQVGEVSTVGRVFGWKGRVDGAFTDVNVSADGDRTTVRVRLALDEVAVGHFMLKGMLFGGLGALVGTALASEAFGATVGALTLIGVVTTAYFWARSGFRGATARYRERAQALADSLVARIQRGGQ